MSRRFRLFVLGGVLFVAARVLGGCAEWIPESWPREDWSNVPAPREPKVNPVRYAHDVRFAPGDARLAGDERDRLEAFLARLGVSARESLIMLTGAGADAAGARLVDGRREAVAAFLIQRRVSPRSSSDVVAAGEIPADAVRVVVERHVVTLPGCPDWSARPGWNFNNTVSSNWGCATATNLGLMAADPADLIAGRDEGTADGERAGLAVRDYRQGKTKPLTPEDVKMTQQPQPQPSGAAGAAP